MTSHVVADVSKWRKVPWRRMYYMCTTSISLPHSLLLPRNAMPLGSPGQREVSTPYHHLEFSRFTAQTHTCYEIVRNCASHVSVQVITWSSARVHQQQFYRWCPSFSSVSFSGSPTATGLRQTFCHACGLHIGHITLLRRPCWKYWRTFCMQSMSPCSTCPQHLILPTMTFCWLGLRSPSVSVVLRWTGYSPTWRAGWSVRDVVRLGRHIKPCALACYRGLSWAPYCSSYTLLAWSISLRDTVLTLIYMPTMRRYRALVALVCQPAPVHPVGLPGRSIWLDAVESFTAERCENRDPLVFDHSSAEPSAICCCLYRRELRAASDNCSWPWSSHRQQCRYTFL